MSATTRGRLGKRVATGLYVLLLTYLIVVGFASVIPAVFFAKGDPAFEDRDCETGLSELRQTLEDQRLAYLAGRRHDITELRSDLSDWDAKLTTLSQICGRDATKALVRYRHRVELSIERYLREDGSMAHELNMALKPPGARE